MPAMYTLLAEYEAVRAILEANKAGADVQGTKITRTKHLRIM